MLLVRDESVICPATMPAVGPLLRNIDAACRDELSTPKIVNMAMKNMAMAIMTSISVNADWLARD
jgi:hypothetical protein